ncbi:cytochrome c [Rhodoferax sp.]|uniref:cytochrome c n=1 Tax=Rhodoferax sp. TaxID=50421 RepID=UPI0025D283E8|nr:cytochrome c [Rhodoferax sp.]
MARPTLFLSAALALVCSAGTVLAQSPANAPVDAQLVAKGAYLARAGDCVACHTAPQGQPFAGGLAISTPIGAVYSTNITPDKTAGIGDWSYEDFARLMRTGVTKAGYTVYPAMPYPSFSRLGDDDLHALYAYFMHGVPPAPTPNKKADIPWPLSMRFPLALWRMAFAPAPLPTSVPAEAQPTLLRGAYLVQGLGHCGACHTARGVAFQEKALTASDSAVYLAGGAAIDGWPVPSLRNTHGGGLALWSKEDIVEFLQTGRNPRSASFGGMNDVVAHSTQYLSETDLGSIALFLKSLPDGTSVPPPFVPDPKVGQDLHAGVVNGRGAQVYLDRCAGCHRSDGQGNGKAFPALAGNAVLQTSDPTSGIKIVLSGSAVPSTMKAPSALTMAPYAGLLNDADIAEVVSFIQTSWGNRSGTATASQVAKLRQSSPAVQPMTAAAFAAGRVVPSPLVTQAGTSAAQGKP